MKPIKQRASEALKIYHRYWDSYSKGDLESFAGTLDETFEMIGTSALEICHTKAEGIRFAEAQITEVVGKVEMRNRQINTVPINDLILVNEQCDLYVLTGQDWNFYSQIRISSLLKETGQGWKVVHQHGSLPDVRVREGETIAFEKISKENLELREAVKRATAELENKNRELEIEAALEKVRARTMVMQHSDELTEVATLLFNQIRELGIKTWTTGFNVWLNGDTAYQDFVTNPEGGFIKPYIIDLTQFPAFIEIREAKLRGDDFFVRLEEGDTIKETYQYLMTSAPEQYGKLLEDGFQFPLKQYEHFVFGKTVSLMFITYETVPEAHDIFKRFGKVFEHTYTRFLDLQRAEAQAREAQIEAALERVRARSMSMHKSEELLSVITVVSEQLQHLNFKFNTVSFAINNQAHDYTFWFAIIGDPKPVYIQVPYLKNPMFDRVKDVLAKGIGFYADTLTTEESRQWHEHVFAHAGLPPMTDETKDYILKSGYARSIAIKTSIMLIVSNYAGQPYSEEENNIIKRFATVFEQSYTRFLDLQKAEAQAREAQVEAAIERVRSRTMAMQHSSELAETSFLLAKQVRALGIKAFGCAFNIFDEDQKGSTEWFSNEEGYQPTYKIPREGLFLRYYEAAQRGESLHIEEFAGEACADHYRYLSTLPVLGDIIKKYTESGVALPSFQIDHVAYFKHGYLLFVTYEPVPEAHEIFKRFAKVFEQTYTRFLDLQKAEAQAREAKIEAALERTRTQSMLMQHSGELNEISKTFHEQLLNLGIDSEFSFLWLPDEKKKEHMFWATWVNDVEGAQNFQSKAIVYPLNKSEPATAACYIAWESEEPVQETYVPPSDIAEFFSTWEELLRGVEKLKPESFPEGIYYTEAYMKYGCFGIDIRRKLDAGEKDIIRRFAVEFERTYTRFLDLKKAEAQAKEAKIVAALERVRGSAMAMHTSEGLLEVIHVLREQMAGLGEKELESIVIHVYNEKKEEFEAWYSYRHTSDPKGKIVHGNVLVHWTKTERACKDKEKYYSEETDYSIVADYKMLKEWYEYLEKVVPEVVEYDEKGKILIPDALYYNYSKFSGGAMLLITNKEASDDSKHLLKRSAEVFNLAYTRFLDLQKAESQAREAQIEAALERVRGKAMAMHSSEDLAATIGTFYHELELFSITPIRCGVGLIDKETRMVELSTVNTTEHGKSIEVIGKLKMIGHPVLEGVFDNWLIQKEYHTVLRGNEIKEYYQLIRPQVAFPEYPNDAVQYGYFFYFVEGGVYAWTEKELTEDELKIYRRFTTVLSLTYKRYKDLKDAEIREKEAVKQAALDRVRADIASMRNAADLDRITPLIWKELNTLGIPFIRCGVFIMDDQENKVHTYLSAPDGRAIAAYHTPMDNSGGLAGAIDHWRQQKVFVTHWVESDFQTQAGILVKHGSITSPEEYLNTLPKAGFHLHFLPFRQGMLYVGSHEPLQSDALHLVRSLADAFSVAYARYEDFKQLGEAKNKMEAAFSELNSTQTQLIHAEKMASLGELTAGIAHEIQNPLNFVNNFSELSAELVDEIEEERAKSQEARDETLVSEILGDIKQNLEKINHHGKRADAIVKGMLQHSRTSSGEKEPTDINDLADEYLRLAYHGLRAKDKSFKAEFNTDFDETLPKIEVIPQGIGRVLLNLINNAFYTVDEKDKSEKLKVKSVNYEPKVLVSTKKSGDEILISVKDNGNGIPDEIKDKIFQPFFTTKPTGQGTGLGLSLSYDIVKAHSGELKVDTKEGEGSEFVVKLPIV